MSWLRGFCTRAVALTSGAALLATMHAIWSSYSPGAAAQGVTQALSSFPSMWAALFPFGTFGAALSIDQSPTRRNGFNNILVCAGAGIVAFVLIGYAAPLLEAMLRRNELHAQTFDHWLGAYHRLSEQQASGEPMLDWTVGLSGVNAYMPLTAAALTALLTALGMCVRSRTALLANRTRAIVHHWLAAAFILASVVMALGASIELAAGHDVAAGLAMMLPVAVPGFLLSALVWNDALMRSAIPRHDA